MLGICFPRHTHTQRAAQKRERNAKAGAKGDAKSQLKVNGACALAWCEGTRKERGWGLWGI